MPLTQPSGTSTRTPTAGLEIDITTDIRTLLKPVFTGFFHVLKGDLPFPVVTIRGMGDRLLDSKFLGLFLSIKNFYAITGNYTIFGESLR